MKISKKSFYKHFIKKIFKATYFFAKELMLLNCGTGKDS